MKTHFPRYSSASIKKEKIISPTPPPSRRWRKNCLMFVNSTEESSQQVADLIVKAREIKPNRLGADKTEILLT